MPMLNTTKGHDTVNNVSKVMVLVNCILSGDAL